MKILENFSSISNPLSSKYWSILSYNSFSLLSTVSVMFLKAAFSLIQSLFRLGVVEYPKTAPPTAFGLPAPF